MWFTRRVDAVFRAVWPLPRAFCSQWAGTRPLPLTIINGSGIGRVAALGEADFVRVPIQCLPAPEFCTIRFLARS